MGRGKKANHLFEGICSPQNLYLAAKKAIKGKKKKRDVQKFLYDFEENLYTLREELLNKTYLPGKYRTFKVYDPKERLISAAPFRDRVVHHALTNVIEPVFEKLFSPFSFANRLGMGVHSAIDLAQELSRKYPYYLKGDIQKYFPSIDHEVLKGLVRKKISCRDTLWLIDLIIDHSNPQDPVCLYFEGDDLFTPLERKRGLPLGNQTSQFFAGVYLNPLDQFVTRVLKAPGYVR